MIRMNYALIISNLSPFTIWDIEFSILMFGAAMPLPNSMSEVNILASSQSSCLMNELINVLPPSIIIDCIFLMERFFNKSFKNRIDRF